ncbi:MAG: metallophosphoesterase, partial [Actinomycetota bacterium]
MVDRQVLIGQLTDTHVVADGVTAADTTTGIDNNGRLRSAVASILAEPAPLDAVVVTGDLVNDARVEEYDTAVELLAPLAAQRGPGTPASVGNRLLPIPGNHDRPGELRRRFPNVPWADTEHTSWVTDVGGVRLIGLDSTRVRAGVVEHGGAVDADRLDWLDRVLGIAHDGPTVLAMHHPPFASGIWWMDRWGFEGLDLLAEVLADRA